MSLELAIAENTQALRELAQMIQAMQAPRLVVMPEGIKAEDVNAEPGTVVPLEKPKAKKAKKEAAPVGEPDAPAPSAPSPAPGAADASETAAVAAPVADPAEMRKEIGALLTSLSARGNRDLAMQLIADHGGTFKLASVPEENYPALLAAVKAAG